MRITSYKFYFLILFGFLIASSCTEEVEVELDSTYTRLVVEGTLTTDTMAHKVKLSTTADYFSNEETPMVTNAQLTIYDGDNTVELNETETGIYHTPENYYGIPGKTYTLTINLDEEINDSFIYTASETMTDILAMDSIAVSFYPFTPFDAWVIQLYADEPSTTNFYGFFATKNDVLLTDTLTEVSISDDRLFNGNYTYGVEVYFLNGMNGDEIVNPGDVITLELANISEDYYYFLSELQEEASGFSNPLFSGAPANVRSNISNEGVGYFAAYGVSKASTVYLGF